MADSNTAARHTAETPRRRVVVLAGLGTAGETGGGVEADRTVALAGVLTGALPSGWHVVAAMRFGQPSISEVVRALVTDGVAELVVVPTYPHFSGATAGTIVQECYRVLHELGSPVAVTVRPQWHDDARYVSAQASRIADFAASHGLRPTDAYLLLVGDGLSDGVAEGTETYAGSVSRGGDLVIERLGWPRERASLAFVGGLAPDAGETLLALASQGERRVLVCPLTSVVGSSDALAAVPTEQLREFEAAGGTLLQCPSLDDYPPFVVALRNLVLRGPRPAAFGRTGPLPLLEPDAYNGGFEGQTKALVVVGASIANSIGAGRGPALRHSDPQAFGRIRKSRKELRAFLDWTREQTHVREAFVWNTCQRVEFWGWLAEPDDASTGDCVVAQVRHRLFGEEPNGLHVNVLFGADAWHHAIRTAAGLNSALPGDTDVVAQLQTSCRIAERAGTAGPRANSLVDDAIEIADDVRAQTGWGSFSVGYCYAALSRVHEGRTDLGERRHLVIGGSATSRSVLSTLSEHFRVPKHLMTLAYRDHHGQMRLLRAAIGSGRRLRVHAYAERPVLRAIADADFVYFGIDHAEPVFEPAVLQGLRDFRVRPLTIIDFNSCGSIGTGDVPAGVTVWTEQDLDRAVSAFAERAFSRERFAAAVAEAEEWIMQHVPPTPPQRLELPCLEENHQPRSICHTCWVFP
jgi:ferrochelatase